MYGKAEGLAATYVYDTINRITELVNICDDCSWVVSRYACTYDERGFITGETVVESLATAPLPLRQMRPEWLWKTGNRKRAEKQEDGS